MGMMILIAVIQIAAIWYNHMLKLKDFLQDIALGELSGTQVVEIGTYEIEPKNIARVIQALNQGLEYFYSNFPIRIEECIVERKLGITKYYLDSQYAYTNTFGSIRYIVDHPQKYFEDNVLHILSVRDTKGFEYPLNDQYNPLSIHTPEYNCIQVSENIKSPYLVVRFQANHPRIPLTETANSQVQIQIPSSYRTALQTYVACLVLQNLGGQHHNESNALFAKFKTLTEELKLNGIGTITQTGTNIKPQLRGWL